MTKLVSKCCGARAVKYPYKNEGVAWTFPEHWSDAEWGCPKCLYPCEVVEVKEGEDA